MRIANNCKFKFSYGSEVKFIDYILVSFISVNLLGDSDSFWLLKIIAKKIHLNIQICIK
jgi:hypothetical protein